MPHPARESIYQAISSIRLIDPHTHINPHSPASSTLADLLGYHYYTELAHSAGMAKSEIEQENLPPRELVGRLVRNLGPLENTAQYRWLIEICRTFFGFDGDRLDDSNWEIVYDSAESQMRLAEWPQMVLDQSNVESVFLTNDFDDELSGFDTDTYIPCLRTDDLVFHLAKTQTRQRLEACSGIELDGSLISLRNSLKQRFEHFVAAGARACAISLPPGFQPVPVSDGRAKTALDEVLRKGALADDTHQLALSRRVFWTLAELCDEFGLPFDLMIGVNRGVYTGGVHQGQDLYDSRVSLIQYRELFNAFPDVKFPVSVLASVTNQELVSYAWIFPNVITNGHWWYSNTPSHIARDAAARLEAVPRTKQIGYYSDAYKLEFVWPKFDMYRQILSGILADHFVGECRWSEERAIELGRQVLRDNIDEIFPRPQQRKTPARAASQDDTWDEEKPPAEDPQSTWIGPAAGGSAALAGGAMGMVEVTEEVNAFAEFESSDSEEPDSASTIIPAETANASERGPNEETVDDFETVLEDPPVGGRQDDPDEVLAQLERFHEDSELAELPTVMELDDTVKIESDHDVLESTTFLPTELDTLDEAGPELDPLPTADEVQEVDVSDVELVDVSPLDSAPDAEAIDADADAEPLYIGDILSDDEAAEDKSSPEVRMLRGESPFTPDEDSLQLQPDPLTGELTFPVNATSDGGDDDESVPSEDDALVLDDVEVVAELEETVDLEEKNKPGSDDPS